MDEGRWRSRQVIRRVLTGTLLEDSVCGPTWLRGAVAITAIPSELLALVDRYEGCTQASVRFRPATWVRALGGASADLVGLLCDDRWTRPYEGDDPRRAYDRTVTREHVAAACDALDLDDPVGVLTAFVLVMVWGSGVTGNRSLRNTASAVANRGHAYRRLAAAASRVRSARTADDGALTRAYEEFSLPGVGQAFFTKWFTFAGHVPGRPWQPLILDSRVYATLGALGISTKELAHSRRLAHRYVAYVTTLHAWAETLSKRERPLHVQRLEWVMFDSNGELDARSNSGRHSTTGGC